jgi:parvulin-like peptidyl-prolyl isomerase
MVMKYSDDPSKTSNAGKFTNVKHGQMVKPFETAAFALKSPGQISDPVKTRYGYHLIRLDQRHEAKTPPFEDIREEAEARMKAKHADSYYKSYLQNLMKDPIVFPKGSVEIMAKRYFGKNLEKAPVYTEDGIQ